MKVEQLMIRDVSACTSAETLHKAAQLMWENDCGCVPVISANGDGKVIGMLTDRDICVAAYTQGKRLIEIPVTTAMSRKLIACKVGDDLKTVEELMHQAQVRRVPVLDEHERLQGIISLNDIAREFGRERQYGDRVQVQAEEIAETLAGVCQPRMRGQAQPFAS